MIESHMFCGCMFVCLCTYLCNPRSMCVCVFVCMYVWIYCTSGVQQVGPRRCSGKVNRDQNKNLFQYWRMQNDCTTSDRFKRFVFQRCGLLLVVNVKKKHTECKYATLYGYETVARWAIILHTPVGKLGFHQEEMRVHVTAPSDRNLLSGVSNFLQRILW